MWCNKALWFLNFHTQRRKSPTTVCYSLSRYLPSWPKLKFTLSLSSFFFLSLVFRTMQTNACLGPPGKCGRSCECHRFPGVKWFILHDGCFATCGWRKARHVPEIANWTSLLKKDNKLIGEISVVDCCTLYKKLERRWSSWRLIKLNKKYFCSFVSNLSTLMKIR